MKQFVLAAVLCLSVDTFAQDVRFDYDRSANFTDYKTYQWVNRPVSLSDQLIDRDIKRAVDEQLAAKGLRRVESSGGLLVGYEAGISQEKQFDAFGSGPAVWGPGLGNFASIHGSTATIDVGTLIVGLFDPAKKQLVWRGAASKTLELNKDPDKNYRTLEKAMAKLFKSYPPGASKGK
jgi:Domain of unknown function (DUF4136)